MARIGYFVTGPKAGTYCRVALDSGERIIVSHGQAGVESGSMTVERVSPVGLTPERLFRCDVDSAEGKALVRFLTIGARGHGPDATPLGALVKYLKTCRSVAEVRARCAELAVATRGAGR